MCISKEQKLQKTLKKVVDRIEDEIFCFWFFSCISYPQAPDYTIRAVLNFFENSRRYSQLKVCHRCC
jgi:hypothetical protein